MDAFKVLHTGEIEYIRNEMKKQDGIIENVLTAMTKSTMRMDNLEKDHSSVKNVVADLEKNGVYGRRPVNRITGKDLIRRIFNLIYLDLSAIEKI